MTRLQMVCFCALALAGTVAVYAALFPHATLTQAEVDAASNPLPMEEFDLIDVGSDYGELTVFDLVGYWLENPPEVEVVATAPRKKHFGGC